MAGYMASFKCNLHGFSAWKICLDKCSWEWEVAVKPPNTSVFIIPGSYVKNEDEQLVILNRIAHAVIEDQRGKIRIMSSLTGGNR